MRVVALGCLAQVLVLVGCSTTITSSEELIQVLANARAGDVVQLGPERITGCFVVPAGVTLQGAGSDRTVLATGDCSDAVGGAPPRSPDERPPLTD